MKSITSKRIIVAILGISLLSAIFLPSTAVSAAVAISNVATESGELPQKAQVTTPVVDGAVVVTPPMPEPPSAGDGHLAPSKPPFPDVASEDWFYEDVVRLANDGIVDGYPDGSFHPIDNITYAEFTKMLVAASADELLDHPVGIFPNHWASEYMDYAYILGIITDDDILDGFSPDMPITRAKMTKMMVLALEIPIAKIESPFTDTESATDDFANTAYNEYLLRGYFDEEGNRIYNGDSNATRGEAAAITVRIMDYKASPYNYRKSAILENAKKNPLLSEAELIDLFHILNREFITEFTFETPIPYEQWSKYYRLANILYLEYFYTSFLNCTYVPNKNTYTVRLEYEKDIEALRGLSYAAEEKAREVLAKIITGDMGDKEKIAAIHDYIVTSCKYDYDNYVSDNISFESRLAYGVLIDGTAICQGYSAAFNLLCKLAGVRSIVVTGTAPNNPERHAWNAVLIDNTPYFIDATHDDPVPDKDGRINRTYFMLTDNELLALGYKWAPEDIQLRYFY